VKLCSYLPELKTKGIKLFNTTQRLTWFSSLATAIILGFMTLLSGCGGGGASATPNIALSVDPAAANLYMGYPTTFTITGGRAPYSISAGDPSIHFTGSSNNTLSINGNTFEVTVDNVNADTSVTLTVRDADGKSATTSVTVKPASLTNSLTVTDPLNAGTQGQASVKATSTTGAPLMGHKVRFHVTDQGAAYGFVCNQTLGDCTAIDTDSNGRILTIETTTDQSGMAYAVTRADVGASTQYATIMATDMGTGYVLRKQFAIAGTDLSALPATATWNIGTGNGNGVLEGSWSTPPVVPDESYGGCSTTSPAYTPPPNGNTNATTGFYVYGGTPPYTITSTMFTVAGVSDTSTGTFSNTTTVLTSGTQFYARAMCTAQGTSNIVIVDSVGKTLSTITFVVNFKW
jgi:hypothetical protein